MDHEFSIAELESEIAVELAPRNLLRVSHSFNNNTITSASNSQHAESGGGDGGSGSVVQVNIQIVGHSKLVINL